MKIVELYPNHPHPMIRAIIKASPEMGKYRVFIGGGAARSAMSGEPVMDLDFFFGDEESRVWFEDMLTNTMGAVRLVETYTCRERHVGNDYMLNGMFIQSTFWRYYDSPIDWLENNDFTICQFYLGLGKMNEGEPRLACFKDSLIDYKTKTLSVYRVTQPVASLARVNKYINKGYLPASNVGFYQPLYEQLVNKTYDDEATQPLIKRKRVQIRVPRAHVDDGN